VRWFLTICLLGTFATAAGAVQPALAPAAGVTIEAKFSPHRLWGVLWAFDDLLEINFYVDERTSDFSALVYSCEFSDKDGQPMKGGIPHGAISRVLFKPSGNGRLVAKSTETLPGAGRGGVKCKALGLAR
jgi:hypothetical protein